LQVLCEILYCACIEDVLDIEHRPLVASKKTKLGIEKLSVLQAPYQLNVQPNLTDKVEFWGGDSSSLRMPALINESIKLQIAKLISLSVEQGIVAEINLRLLRESDLHPYMHEDDTFCFSDRGDHGNLFGLKFQRKEDGDCVLSEEQESMIAMQSNKHVRYIVLCIGSERLKKQEHLKGGSACLRRSERLEKQKHPVIEVQKNKPVRKHYERKQGFTVKSKELRQQQRKGNLAIKCPSHASRKNHKDIASSGESCHLQAQGEEIEYAQQKQKFAVPGRSTSKRLRDPHIETLHSKKSKCLWEHDRQSKNSSKSHIATQVEGIELTEKQNTGKQLLTLNVDESDATENKEIDINSEIPCQQFSTTDNKEINTKSERQEVTAGMLDMNESRSIISNTNSWISTKSDNSNREFQISRDLKDREKHTGEIPHPTLFPCSRKDNNLNISPEKTNIHCEPILTDKVESAMKGLMENNMKEKFQHFSGSTEIENDRPCVPFLAICSMVEKKIEIQDDLLSDLRINEDGLNFNGNIEEENSALKNLWTEMEQTSHGDENNLNLSPEKTTSHCEPILTEKVEYTEIDLVENNIKERLQRPYANIANEIYKPSVPILARCSMVEKKVQGHGDLISDLRINEDGLNFNGISEEENLVLKNLLEQTSDGDENNFNLSQERTNICGGPILTDKVDSTKKHFAEYSITERFQHCPTSTLIDVDKSTAPILGRCPMVEKKLEVHEDLIYDLRINEDSLNFHGIIKEENSDFKSLWKEMEQISHEDENNLNLSPEKTNIDWEPILVHEDLTSDLRISKDGLNSHGIIKEENSDFKTFSEEMEQISQGDENHNLSPEKTNIACEVHEDVISDLRINAYGLNFHGIIKEENSDPKKLSKEMEQILRGDENNFNLSPERTNTDCKPILTAKVESTKKNLVDNNIKKTFHQVSARIASENVKPSIPILARWSIREENRDP
jgi:hypothetical protein